MSPDFYSIYVDDLISHLIKLGIGCYVCGLFAAALLGGGGGVGGAGRGGA